MGSFSLGVLTKIDTVRMQASSDLDIGQGQPLNSTADAETVREAVPCQNRPFRSGPSGAQAARAKRLFLIQVEVLSKK